MVPNGYSRRIFDWRLEKPPHLIFLGEGTHGKDPEERVLRYSLGNAWCVHFYTYEGELGIADERFPIRPGYVSVIPPNTRLEWRFRGASTHCCAIFTLDEPGPDSLVFGVPAMRDLGNEFLRFQERMKSAIGIFPFNRRWAEARVWDILWELSLVSMGPKSSVCADRRVVRTLDRIERGISGPLRIPDLAAETGLSVNQLERLFKRQMNKTIVAYIRCRRVERARDLLLSSSMPTKAIADEVGFPDLVCMHKAFKLELNMPPGMVRRNGRHPLPEGQ